MSKAKDEPRICRTCGRDLDAAGPRPKNVLHACNNCGYAWRSCETCGEPQRWDDPTHDYIERIVRPHNNYGGHPAGTRVRVEPQHLDSLNVMAATMSLDEAEALDKHRREAPLRNTEVPRLSQAVMRAQEAERIRLEQQNEQARKRARREANQAEVDAKDWGV